jgi:hypothetical protein
MKDPALFSEFLADSLMVTRWLPAAARDCSFMLSRNMEKILLLHPPKVRQGLFSGSSLDPPWHSPFHPVKHGGCANTGSHPSSSRCPLPKPKTQRSSEPPGSSTWCPQTSPLNTSQGASPCSSQVTRSPPTQWPALGTAESTSHLHPLHSPSCCPENLLVSFQHPPPPDLTRGHHVPVLIPCGLGVSLGFQG